MAFGFFCYLSICAQWIFELAVSKLLSLWLYLETVGSSCIRICVVPLFHWSARWMECGWMDAAGYRSLMNLPFRWLFGEIHQSQRQLYLRKWWRSLGFRSIGIGRSLAPRDNGTNPSLTEQQLIVFADIWWRFDQYRIGGTNWWNSNFVLRFASSAHPALSRYSNEERSG